MPPPPSSSSSPPPDLPSPSSNLYQVPASFFLSFKHTMLGDFPFFCCTVTPSISFKRPERANLRVLPLRFEMVSETVLLPLCASKSLSFNSSRPSSSMYTLTCFLPSDQPYLLIAWPSAWSASPFGRESSQLYLPAAAPSYSIGFAGAAGSGSAAASPASPSSPSES